MRGDVGSPDSGYGGYPGQPGPSGPGSHGGSVQAMDNYPAAAAPRSHQPTQYSLGSYSSYAEAEELVDYLADQRFPVEQVTVVGHGLQSVEEVTGRLTTAGAMLRAAVSGALVGALLGWVFGLLDLVNPLVASAWLALYGLLIGAVIGGLFGLLAQVATGGRRDFSSIGSVRATSYEVRVEAAVAAEAARLLEEFAPTRMPAAGPRDRRGLSR